MPTKKDELELRIIKLPGRRVKQARFPLVGIGALFVIGCIGAVPPKSPKEALHSADLAVAKLLENARASEAPPSRVDTQTNGSNVVTFWYMSHPAIGTALETTPPASDTFALKALFIGEDDAATQKLIVAVAAGDLPDVALVDRSLVPMLFDAGRTRALDAILSAELMRDLRDEARADYTYRGQLIGLPADGYCSVLFCSRPLTGDAPPKNWVFFNAHSNAYQLTTTSKRGRKHGAYPFLEALWSTGGDVVQSGTPGLATPEALRALEFVTLATGGTARSEQVAFQDFLDGVCAMTVASSRYIARANAAGLDYVVAPVPGETGPISRRSNVAVVVFAREMGAPTAAIAAFLDWLTGSEVYTETAAINGNVPIRKSAASVGLVPVGVADAYQSGRNTPLIPQWAGAEIEVERAIAEAYAFEDLVRAESRGKVPQTP